MGRSSSTADDMRARAAYRATSGTSFAHSATTASAPRHLRKVHESLDPMWKNTVGEQIRECLDSDEHPLTLPVFFGFDETGSMGGAPRLIQEKLALLKGATLRAGLVDAQLCFGAYGDAQNHEVAPCQVGQFESGVEMEEWLNNLYLEGNGGGNNGETAGLLLWFLANYSRLDSVEKRGKKGYIILTGDEVPLPVTRQEIETYIGVTVERDFTMEEVVEQAKKLYDIYFFLVDNGAAKQQGSYARWTQLLGVPNVIVVENLENISEQVTILIARNEGLIDSIDAGVDLLTAEGADPAAVRKAGEALVPFETHIGSVANVTQIEGKLPATDDTSGAASV